MYRSKKIDDSGQGTMISPSGSFGTHIVRTCELISRAFLMNFLNVSTVITDQGNAMEDGGRHIYSLSQLPMLQGYNNQRPINSIR